MTRAFLAALFLSSTVLAQTEPKTVPAATPAATAVPTPSVKQNVKYTAVQKLVKSSTVGGKVTESVIDSPLTVVRGDLLVEEITVQNVGAQTLPQVTVSLPMPDGTSFTGTATAPTARLSLAYSTDGGRNFMPTPQRVTSVTENGKTVLKKAAAPMADVTNVRWVIRNLAGGETLKLTYRVKVD